MKRLIFLLALLLLPVQAFSTTYATLEMAAASKTVASLDIDDEILILVDGNPSLISNTALAGWISQTILAGNVNSPGSVTDNGVPTYDGTTGRFLQDSGFTMASGVLTGGDANTHVTFTPDRILFTAGGLKFLELMEASTDIINLNVDSLDVNYLFETNNSANTLYIDGGNDCVQIAGADCTTTGALKLGSGAEVTTILDEDTLSSDSATALATQQSIKAYVDAFKPTEAFCVAASDETTDLTTGAAKITFRIPYAFTLSDVRSSLTAAPTGSVQTTDINESGTTILSTKLTIDATEKTSETAAAAAVISDSSLADDAEITVDVDGVGSTTPGKGLKICLIGSRT